MGWRGLVRVIVYVDILAVTVVLVAAYVITLVYG
jgi:hypothetical protein